MQMQRNRAGAENVFQSLRVDGRILTMLIVLIVVWTVFQLLTLNQPGQFLSPQNLWNLSVQTAVVGIMVGGMVLVIVTRQIDLSVGSVLGFTGMIMALIQTVPPLGWGGHWLLALLVGLALGALIGAFQGYWVAYWGVPAFVVTLAGLLIFRNATFIVASGRTIGPLNDSFKVLGGGLNGSIGETWTWVVGGVVMLLIVYHSLSNRSRRQKNGLPVRPMWAEGVVMGFLLMLTLAFVLVMNAYTYPGTNIPRGIPVPVLITLLVLFTLNWVTLNTRFGRYVFAIGGNPEAALLAGINVRRMLVWVFALMGLLAALAGAVQAARLNFVTNSMGNLLELDVIAAAVIGGTALAGGSGTIVGAAMGALLMSSLRGGMVLLGLPTEWQNVVLGAVLLAAVIWNTVYLRNQKS
ncbi:sugar ABC transporter permease [Meiothermus sp. Pnk-1]|uniref:sugar ABC transporter permease n=2 Tax=unclassified Meiothermus TaxID=370471 RepID=UPI000D7CCD25|nr:sugar ABC transporter permease [Meiothermus sp. Pnk-1]PZA07079.1 sugar ABC transporter permease [Meiothermus sp. Pnk-1]RYM40041.1 sugar ABC transporter permease [Meiothermus sp. PNK-Is4]